MLRLSVGNTATPGAIESSGPAAKTAAAQETAGAENQIVQADYAQGNKNYESAVGQEENLPNVFNPATSAQVGGPPPDGLSQAEAQKRLAQYGPNEIEEKEDQSVPLILYDFWLARSSG